MADDAQLVTHLPQFPLIAPRHAPANLPVNAISHAPLLLHDIQPAQQLIKTLGGDA